MSNQVQLLLAQDEAEKFLSNDDVQGFIAHMNALLQQRDGSNFMVLVGCINSLLSKVPSGRGEVFIIKCLDVLHDPQQHHISLPPISSGLPFLLLESVPLDSTGRSIHAKTPHVQAAALECFNWHCEPDTAKVALRLAQLFGLTLADLQQLEYLSFVQPGRLIECIERCRHLGKPGLTSAIGLLKQFKGLEEHFDCAAVLSQLVESGQDGLAQSWVSVLSPDMKAMFIHQCMAADRYKSAKNAVHALGLQSAFPDVEKIYRQRTFARLTSRGLWSVAATFAGNDKAMQESLVRMTALHDLQQADLLRAQFGLPEEFLDPAEVARALAENEALRAGTYLMLDVPFELVLIVDSRERLQTAAGILRGAPPVIGIDVEWRPTGGSGRASLMQVATLDQILLFDLFTLGLHKDGSVHTENLQALDDCLGPTLHDSSSLKVGFELMGDLKMLANSWPMVAAFQTVHNVFEMRELWTAYLRTRNRPGVAASLRFSGLSTLSSTLLGRPLDKSMQISDWEQRPMTARQVEYAAQDAHVLVRLYYKLQEQVPNASTVVAHHTTTFSASGSRASRQRITPPIGPSSDSPGTGNTSAVGAAEDKGKREDDDGDDDGTSGRDGGNAGEGQAQQGVGFNGAAESREGKGMRQEGVLPEQSGRADVAMETERETTTWSGWGTGVESGRQGACSSVPLARAGQHAAHPAAHLAAALDGSSSAAGAASHPQHNVGAIVAEPEVCAVGEAAAEAATATATTAKKTAGNAELQVGRDALEGLPAGIRQRLMESVGLGNSVIRLPSSQGISTVADAARTLGTDTSQIVKSMALILAGHTAGQIPGTDICCSSGSGGSTSTSSAYKSQAGSSRSGTAVLMPGGSAHGAHGREGQKEGCEGAMPLHAHGNLFPQQEPSEQQQEDPQCAIEKVQGVQKSPLETKGGLQGVSGGPLISAPTAVTAPADVAADAAASPSCLLAVLQGDRRLDLRKVAIHARIPRKHMRVATAEECLQVLGCVPGTIPPFAPNTPKCVQVVVDERLVQQQQQQQALQQDRVSSDLDMCAGNTQHEKQRDFEGKQEKREPSSLQTSAQGQHCNKVGWGKTLALDLVKQQQGNSQRSQPQVRKVHDGMQEADFDYAQSFLPLPESPHSEEQQHHHQQQQEQQQQQQQRHQQQHQHQQHQQQQQQEQHQQQQQQQQHQQQQQQEQHQQQQQQHQQQHQQHQQQQQEKQHQQLQQHQQHHQQQHEPKPPQCHHAVLFCGAGTPNHVIALTAPQLLTLSGGSVADIAAAPQPSPADHHLSGASHKPVGTGPNLASPSPPCPTAAAVTAASAAAAEAALCARPMAVSPCASRSRIDSDFDGTTSGMATAGVPNMEAIGRRGFSPKFLCDSMLGRLCRWLRAMGVDTELVGQQQQQWQAQQELKTQQQASQQQQQLKLRQRHQQGGSSVPQVAVQAMQAAANGRIFLTRDTRLASRKDCVAAAPYLLSTDDPAQQLREVSRQWGLAFDSSRAMSRCSNCNAAQFMLLSREEAATMVPPKVFQIVDEFYKCGACSKTYWMGPKSYSAVNLLEGVLGQQEHQQRQPPT